MTLTKERVRDTCCFFFSGPMAVCYDRCKKGMHTSNMAARSKWFASLRQAKKFDNPKSLEKRPPIISRGKKVPFWTIGRFPSRYLLSGNNAMHKNNSWKKGEREKNGGFTTHTRNFFPTTIDSPSKKSSPPMHVHRLSCWVSASTVGSSCVFWVGYTRPASIISSCR